MKYKNFSRTKKDKAAVRIEAFQKILKEKQIDACVIEDPTDLFYFTGISLSAGQLWIHQKEALLLVDGRYIESVLYESRIPAALVSREALQTFCEKKGFQTIAFDAGKLSYQRVLEIKKHVRNAGLEKNCKWIPLLQPASAIRMIKDKKEVVSLRKSADLLWKGYLYIKQQMEEGMTEKELARQFEIYCIKHGADGLAFEPIIAFGENSAMPHYRAGNRKLKRGDIVLIDIGAVLDRYHSDMTRVVFFGEGDSLLQSWYKIIQKAHDKALALCRPGVRVGKLDEAVREVFKKEQVEPYFVHSLGHGIGLETHEVPRIRFDNAYKDVILEPGMVFTIEPGLYLPGRGGVRYENMILITEKGNDCFFPF
jgi:Xaa-Pro aminopeptidase